MIFIAVLGVILTVTFWFKPVTDDPVESILPIIIFFGGLFLLTVYGVVYSSLYSVIISKDKVLRKSLFGKVEFSFTEVKEFTLRKYSKKSELYQFDININGKIIKLYTRYYNELKELLELYSLRRN